MVNFIIKSKYFFVFILIFWAARTVSFAQCVDKEAVFEPGEKIYYDAVYNWGFIWLNAGNVIFAVDSADHNGKEAIRFSSYGKSLPSYDWFFKVRDYFQSVVRPTDMRPLKFERKTSEGGYKVHNRYQFDYQDKRIASKTENSDKPYMEDSLRMKDCVYDVLSGVYFTRNIDYSKYAVNDTIPIRMIIDNEIYDLYLRYHGKEQLKMRNGQVFPTIKFTALLVEGTIFKGGEDLTVWVSDDKNKVPILIEAKILVGSVKAVLREFENLKYPSVLDNYEQPEDF